MAENKPEKSLVETPVEYLCGSPKEQSGAGGIVHGGETIPGEHKETAGATPTVTFYEETKG